MASPPRQHGDVLLHPVRMRIVVALAGRALTPSQLRAELADVPQATLYQHLGKLTRAGALRVVEERPVRGAVERVYALNESSAALHPPALDPANIARTPPDEWRRYYAVFIAALLADGSRYLASGALDLLRDGFGFRQVALNLSDEEFKAMVIAMNTAITPYLAYAPGPGRRRRLFATVMIPQAATPPDENAPPEPTPGETA
ncbi:MAG TPA: helix-turn-helix domain-containing protein [Ktedonobacterales bacterium]|nr:helix-turn-helix domain-containing protein [Ktedonobacterales bacterium]